MLGKASGVYGASGQKVEKCRKCGADKIVKFGMKKDAYSLPDYEDFMAQMTKITALAREGAIASMYALGAKGIAEAVSKMGFGNKLGAKICAGCTSEEALFAPAYGEILAEVTDVAKLDAAGVSYYVVGEVTEEPVFAYGGVKVSMEDALAAWTDTLERVFPTRPKVK